MNDHKIERSNGRCFDRQQLSTDSMEISFPMKKKSVVTARYLQSIKTFLTLELSQYRKSGSMFSSSEPVAIHTNMCTMYLACIMVCIVVTNVVCIESVLTIQ